MRTSVTLLWTINTTPIATSDQATRGRARIGSVAPPQAKRAPQPEARGEPANRVHENDVQRNLHSAPVLAACAAYNARTVSIVSASAAVLSGR